MTQLLRASAGVVALSLALPALAHAQTVRLTTTLTGGEETPPVLTGAAGTAEVFVDVDNRELTVTLKVFNLPTGATAAHIHIGPKGLAAPVVVDFPFPVGRVGDVTLTFRVGVGQLRARPSIGINTIEDAIQAILAGNSYINVHTTANPGGEIRGQLEVAN